MPHALLPSPWQTVSVAPAAKPTSSLRNYVPDLGPFQEAEIEELKVISITWRGPTSSLPSLMKRFNLAHAQIQAQEPGMNPKKFGRLANHEQETWKRPLGNGKGVV